MEYWARDVEKLKGRLITGIKISENATYLLFETNLGPIGLSAHGDCCSESWFEHLSNADALLNAIVNDVVSLEENSMPGTRQDVDILYGIEIKTNKGTATLEFRNSSNGYYGGSISCHLGVSTNEKLKALTADL